MIALLFWFLASFFNAVMDATENAPNFNESIFKKLPVQFWLKEQSWKYAPKIFNYRLDCWHIAKSCMVLYFLFSVLLFDLPLVKWQDWALYIIVAGILWNGGFWLFYHKIFRVK
jgi:hypothetical protein